MDNKNVLLSVLRVGVGVGVGLWLASGQALSKWTSSDSSSTGVTLEKMEKELPRQVVDGRESKVTFDEFPYYLSEQTRELLTSAAYVHLKHADVSKYTRNLSPASQAILLCGPAVSAFLCPCNNGGSEWSNLPRLRRNASAAANIDNLAAQGSRTTPGPLKQTSSWSFNEKLLIQALYKVLVYVSKRNPTVLHLRDVDKLLLRSQRIYNSFQKMLRKLSGPILILGSQVVDLANGENQVDDRLSVLFPYNIEIRAPEDKRHLVSWKFQLEDDMKKIQPQDNRIHIMEVLSANDLDCDDLDSVCLEDAVVLGSLSHGLSIFQEGKSISHDTVKSDVQAADSREAASRVATDTKPE